MKFNEIEKILEDYNFILDKDFSTCMTKRYYKRIGKDMKIYIVLRYLHNTIYFLLTYKNENLEISSSRDIDRVNNIYLDNRLNNINKFIFSYKKIFDYMN